MPEDASPEDMPEDPEDAPPLELLLSSPPLELLLPSFPLLAPGTVCELLQPTASNTDETNGSHGR
jgi:hypothetical protein